MFDIRGYGGGMSGAVQGSLLDDLEDVGLRSLAATRRTELSRGAWLDVRRGWLTGAGALFERLARDVPWRGERRQMYDRIVDVPRLVCFYDEEDPLPDPVLDSAREALSTYYAIELGEPFRTAGLCYYRDGRDSVAWHGDRIGRGNTEDTMVAIVSTWSSWAGPASEPGSTRYRRRRRPSGRGSVSSSVLAGFADQRPAGVGGCTLRRCRLRRRAKTMDSREEREEWFRLLLAEQRDAPLDPLKETRTFLRFHVSDAESLDEIRDDAARLAGVNPRPVRTALRAIEALIADPPRDGTLAWLVEIDGNWVLDDPGDSGAIEFLHEITVALRDALARASGARPDG
jgi:alkylated DNA repair dioxygenase AlkB